MSKGLYHLDDGWIAPYDRFPPQDTWVLALRIDGNITKAKRHTDEQGWNGWIDDEDYGFLKDGHLSLCSERRIIGWQPLPKC